MNKWESSGFRNAKTCLFCAHCVSVFETHDEVNDTEPVMIACDIGKTCPGRVTDEFLSAASGKAAMAWAESGYTVWPHTTCSLWKKRNTGSLGA